MGVPQRVQTIVHDAELLVSCSGRSTINTAGLPSIRHDEADRAAGDGVGDEELLAVDDVLIAVEDRRGAQGCEIGAGTRFGQREAGQRIAAGEPRQESLFLFGCAEGAHRIDGADAAVDRGQAGDHGVLGRHLRQEVREARERCALPAVLTVDEHPQ